MKTFIILILIWSCDPGIARNCEYQQDPCIRYNTRPIPNEYSRHPTISLSSQTSSYCDLFNMDATEWYISDYNMTSVCPDQEQCCTRLPIWMNDTMPKPHEGAVNKTLCVRTYEECCAGTMKVLVKSCTYYNVYCFWELPPSCPSRYCFDVDLSRTTTTTTTTTTTATTVASSTTSTTENHTKDDIEGPKPDDNKDVIIALTAVLGVALCTIMVLSGVVVALKKKAAFGVSPSSSKKALG